MISSKAPDPSQGGQQDVELPEQGVDGLQQQGESHHAPSRAAPNHSQGRKRPAIRVRRLGLQTR